MPRRVIGRLLASAALGTCLCACPLSRAYPLDREDAGVDFDAGVALDAGNDDRTFRILQCVFKELVMGGVDGGSYAGLDEAMQRKCVVSPFQDGCPLESLARQCQEKYDSGELNGPP